MTLPALEERTITTALTLEEANQTALGQTLSPLVADHPDKSGIVALTDALEAFAARLLLVENAEKNTGRAVLYLAKRRYRSAVAVGVA